MTTTVTEQQTSILGRLDKGFRSGTYGDYTAMERLLSGEVPGAEESDPWRGLRHKPITSWPAMLRFLSGEKQEYSLRDVATELELKGGHLALLDTLKWMAGINLAEVRLFGGHPHEPEKARADPRPAFWNWKFTEGGLLTGLHSAFRGASSEEIGALDNLRRRTEGHHHRTGEPLRNGLADQPFWYFRLISYFMATGAGRYILAEVENDVLVKGPGNKAVMHHGNIRSFLHWSNQKGVLEVSFERPERGAEDRQVGFTVNTDPLAEKWNL